MHKRHRANAQMPNANANANASANTNANATDESRASSNHEQTVVPKSPPAVTSVSEAVRGSVAAMKRLLKSSLVRQFMVCFCYTGLVLTFWSGKYFALMAGHLDDGDGSVQGNAAAGA